MREGDTWHEQSLCFGQEYGNHLTGSGFKLNFKGEVKDYLIPNWVEENSIDNYRTEYSKHNRKSHLAQYKWKDFFPF